MFCLALMILVVCHGPKLIEFFNFDSTSPKEFEIQKRSNFSFWSMIFFSAIDQIIHYGLIAGLIFLTCVAGGVSDMNNEEVNWFLSIALTWIVVYAIT